MRPTTSPHSSPRSVRYSRDASPRREQQPKPDVVYVERDSRPQSAPRDITINQREPRSRSLPRETTFYTTKPTQSKPDITYVHRDQPRSDVTFVNRSPSPKLRTIVHRAADEASDISRRSRPSTIRETHIHERPRSGSTIVSKQPSTVVTRSSSPPPR